MMNGTSSCASAMVRRYRYTPLHTTIWRHLPPPTALRGWSEPYVAVMTDDIGYVYLRVADLVEADIRSGKLPRGARLPNERDMGAQYGVAPGTARRAAKELRERGLVVTLPNKGTFVVEPPA